MASQNTRYFVFNRHTLNRTGEYRSVKNAETREEARAYKRYASNASNLGIFDRFNGKVIR